MLNKKSVIEAIITQLSIELKKATVAASQAKNAATDDQSKAETQYDTLAIEASYLAEGQSKRVNQFQQMINAYEALLLQQSQTSPPETATINSLVQLAQDATDNHWFFIGPSAGGFRVNIGDYSITVITPESPMGKSLLGKMLDDEIAITIGTATLTDCIVNLR